MQLYYAPLACSMASRISLYEAGASAEWVYVDIHTDPKARVLPDGSDYFALNPMGQVPCIRTAEGELLSENAVVLQYIADQYPQSRLAPPAGIARYRLQQWLSFIGTELHKGTFNPLLVRDSPEGAKAFARQRLPLRFGRLNQHLSDSQFLLEHFTVADAYLLTVLNWAPHVGIDLAEWPAVQAYVKRLAQRPSVVRAMKEEGNLFREEQSRRATA